MPRQLLQGKEREREREEEDLHEGGVGESQPGMDKSWEGSEGREANRRKVATKQRHKLLREWGSE